MAATGHVLAGGLPMASELHSSSEDESDSESDNESDDDDGVCEGILPIKQPSFPSTRWTTGDELQKLLMDGSLPSTFDRTSRLYTKMVQRSIATCATVNFIDRVIWIASSLFDAQMYGLHWLSFRGYMIVYEAIYLCLILMTWRWPVPMYRWYTAVLGIDLVIFCINPQLAGHHASMNGRATLYWAMCYVSLMPLAIPDYRIVIIYSIAFCSLWFTVHVVKLQLVHTERPWEELLDVSCCSLAVLASAIGSVYRRGKLEEVEWRSLISDLAHKNAAGRLMLLLQDMVPPFILQDMLRSSGTRAYKFDRVSVLFVMIEGFDLQARTKTPAELLDYLNKVFTRFDAICAKHDVTKIETVGEEFVCAVGVRPEDSEQDRQHGHQWILDRLLRAASDISQERNVQTKMGVHTGPVVAGVLGHKLPRFRLFGDAVNTAARMMQKSFPGVLQFGEETRCHLPSWASYSARGLVDMKGKDFVMTYNIRFPLAHDNAQIFDRRPTAADGSHRIVMEHGEIQDDDSDSSAGSTVLPMAMDKLQSEESVRLEDGRRSQERAETAYSVVETLSASQALRIKDHRAAVLRQCCQCGETDDKFEGWRQWFHSEYICPDIHQYAQREIQAILALSILEFAYMFARIELRSMSFDSTVVRTLCTYSACRVCCVLNIKAWSVAWEHCSLAKPWTLLLVEESISVNLILLSYLALLGVFIQVVEPDPNKELQLHGMSMDILSMTFLATYLLLVMSRRFPFREACIFALVHAAPAFAFAVLVLKINERTSITASMWIEVYLAMYYMGCFIMLFRSLMLETHIRRQWYATSSAVKVSEGIRGTVDSLLPPLVVQSFQKKQSSHEFKEATILQADLCGFTKLASRLQPEDVMKFIGEIFERYDNLADKYGIYKVETVGDAYIAGQAERPLTSRRSPLDVVRFGLEMATETEAWARSRAEPINCRIGIHHGECVGGVVGNAMKRYHLFGRIMSIMEVLESTSPEGMLQVSDACRRAVQRQVHEEGIVHPDIRFTQRTEPVLTTSKGIRHTYDEVDGPTFLVVRENGSAVRAAAPQTSE